MRTFMMVLVSLFLGTAAVAQGGANFADPGISINDLGGGVVIFTTSGNGRNTPNDPSLKWPDGKPPKDPVPPKKRDKRKRGKGAG